MALPLAARVTSNTQFLHSTAQHIAERFDREIVRLFWAVDQDGDGELSKGELFSFLRAYKSFHGRADWEDDEDDEAPLLLDESCWEESFALVDADGSETVSLAEFRAFVVLNFVGTCDVCERMITCSHVWSCPSTDYDECMQCNLDRKRQTAVPGLAGQSGLQLVPLEERLEPHTKHISETLDDMAEAARKARETCGGRRIVWEKTVNVFFSALEMAQQGLEFYRELSTS